MTDHLYRFSEPAVIGNTISPAEYGKCTKWRRQARGLSGGDVCYPRQATP